MSAVTEELLGHQLSVELLTTPSAPDWQPRDGGYHAGPYRLQVEPIVRARDTALRRIQVSREDGQPPWDSITSSISPIRRPEPSKGSEPLEGFWFRLYAVGLGQARRHQIDDRLVHRIALALGEAPERRR